MVQPPRSTRSRTTRPRERNASVSPVMLAETDVLARSHSRYSPGLPWAGAPTPAHTGSASRVSYLVRSTGVTSPHGRLGVQPASTANATNATTRIPTGEKLLGTA